MAIKDRPGQTSKLLDYLPAIFQEGSAPGQPNFLGHFLLAFEAILLGFEENFQEDGELELGLEDNIAKLDRFFDPNRTPLEFLPWLASWLAFSLRQDWDEVEQRRFISQIVPLYKHRGTQTGMAKMLHTYTGMGVEVRELISAFQVEKTSTVGVDTVIEGGPPHYFFVKMFLDSPDPTLKERKEQIAQAIIDREKPTHTYYDLEIEVPIMQIEVHSTVGVDTLLGIPE